MPQRLHCSIRLIALIGTVVVTVSSCGGGATVQRGGTVVQNAEEFIEQADAAFSDLIKADVDDGTATISEDSRCYFLRLDEDDVDHRVYCGPIRTLNAGADESWYAFPSDGVEQPDEGLILQLPPTDDAELTSVAVDQLFRPDGAEPIEVSAVDEPQAPEAPLANFATLVEATSHEIDAEFTDLGEPFRLVTPSATLTVTAAAELDAVPASIVDLAVVADGGETEQGENRSPVYRPADGQQVRAWRLTIGTPPELAPSVDRWGDEDGRDASTAYALGSGSQRLSISGALTAQGGSAGIPCGQMPCTDMSQVQYVLVASGTSEASPTLIATVDGTDQVLDLDTGELTSQVSQVLYHRSDSFQQVSTVWGTETVHLADEDELCAYCDSLDYNFGGEVQRVYLTPFAARKGWAPAGKAWLLVPVDNDPAGLTDRYLGAGVTADEEVDLTKSWTLEVGGEIVAHDPDAAAGYTAAFLVADTFTEGTFRYQPSGSISYTDPDRTEPLEAEEPLTLDITFP